jgi:tetratricopeptide (TPR) repeat protein
VIPGLFFVFCYRSLCDGSVGSKLRQLVKEVALASEKRTEKSAAERYVETYLALGTQPAEEAPTDTQLATIVLDLNQRIGQSNRGAVVDIGCGQSTLLNRLSELPTFRSNSEWVYIGVDQESSIARIRDLERTLKLRRRVEVYSLEEFYSEWPETVGNEVIVCRNVLHELQINDTATLLYHIATCARKNGLLLIQDLLRFPNGERHNACWDPNELKTCLDEFGFAAQEPVVQGTRNGNAFFNLIATAVGGSHLTADESRKAVANARHRQWVGWMEIEQQSSQNLPSRDELVNALDLQVTALTRQLRDVGFLNAVLAPSVERRVRTSAFTRVIEDGIKAGLSSSFKADEIVHFRERGSQLNVLEGFLRGASRLAIVHGGSGYGKTTLVKRLLATRSYGKLIVQVDGRRTKGAWAFLEELFSQVGIRLAPEQLSVLSNLEIDSISPIIRRFLNEASSRLILFYDNFHEVEGADGSGADPDLMTILSAVVSKERVKVILTSRSEYAPRRLLEATKEAPTTVRVGRYATDETVANILDDYFDRAASGLGEYPRSLLDAIDRHPLITSLAARALQTNGAELILDQEFINELANRLRDNLWGRIVGVAARQAVAVAGNLRVPVPLSIIEGLAEKDSIATAQEEEVIYAQSDQRWMNLWATLGLFRAPINSESTAKDALEGDGSFRLTTVDHSKVSSLYRSIYRIDDDPKWIRESYYHQLLSIDRDIHSLSEGLGNYYYDELVSSADYHFVRGRNFAAALDLYRQAVGIRALKQTSEMRRASCLIRLGQKAEGEKAYRNLVDLFPEHHGIKTSHVDAILYRHEFDDAAKALREYDLSQDTEWVQWQWGRTYLGLDEYEPAIATLSKIVTMPNPDSHYFIYLARALDFAGDALGALSILDQARRRFGHDVGVNSAYGGQLQRVGKIEEAAEILRPLLQRNADNIQAAWALAKIAIEQNSTRTARDIFRKIENAAPPDFKNLVRCVQAEVEIAEGHPELALTRLDETLEPDPLVWLVILQALRAAVSNPLTSAATLRRSSKIRVPDRYLYNARIQIAQAELALALKDRKRWDQSVDSLAKTRLPKDELSRILNKWPGR